jgi:hypothetical protein
MSDFGDLPVFEETTTYPCLMFLEKASPTTLFPAANVDTLDFPETLHQYLTDHQIEVQTESLQPTGWVLTDRKVSQLLEKIRAQGTPLGEYVDGKIYYGIKTGLNEAFVIDEETKDRLIAEDPKSAEVIKPFLAGRDIKRYEQPEVNKWLILFRSGDTKSWFGNLPEEKAHAKMKEAYPAIMNWLEPFTAKAKKRYDKGQYWWELRACDYYDEFEKPKIMLPDISLRGNFTMDTAGGQYIANTAYIIGSDEKWLLAVLASDLIDFFYRNLAASYRGGYLRFIYQYLELIPVPQVGIEPKRKLGSLVEQVLNGVENKGDLIAEIDEVVFELFGLAEMDRKLICAF